MQTLLPVFKLLAAVESKALQREAKLVAVELTRWPKESSSRAWGEKVLAQMNARIESLEKLK